jgi:hypothetical protein
MTSYTLTKKPQEKKTVRSSHDETNSEYKFQLNKRRNSFLKKTLHDVVHSKRNKGIYCRQEFNMVTFS